MTIFRILHQDTSIEVPPGEFLIGRSAECNLVLDDPSVSRVHAAVHRDADRLYIEDRGSRNGVVLNFAHIQRRTPLRDGDSIAIGHQTIRVVILDRAVEENRTVRIERDSRLATSALKDPTEPSIIEQQPIILMAGLATKAIRVHKLDEAERLVPNLLNIAQKKAKSDMGLNDEELAAITGMMVSLADASENPEQLSRLFGFHLALDRLMARRLVEDLYDLARAIGYRACPQMIRYLTRMGAKEQDLNPSERFILRRLEGLVKLCS